MELPERDWKAYILDRCTENPTTGCWNWDLALRHGYGLIQVRQDGKRLKLGAHRVSLHVLGGGLPDGLFALHRCDNKQCVNPDHLYAGTQATNVRDAVARGQHRVTQGIAHHNSNLTDEEVAAVVVRHAQGETYKELAAELGVTFSAVGYWCTGRNRKKAYSMAMRMLKS